MGLRQGRAFLPEEDRQGAAPAIIVSYGLWQRFFAGSPSALRKPLVLDGKPYTIVGVAPPGFRINENEGEVFALLGQDPSPNMQNCDRRPGIQVLARLRPGVNLARTHAALVPGILSRAMKVARNRCFPQPGRDG